MLMVNPTSWNMLFFLEINDGLPIIKVDFPLLIGFGDSFSVVHGRKLYPLHPGP